MALDDGRMDEALMNISFTAQARDTPPCECMACDIPLAHQHGPVSWKLSIHFPGPYPLPGDVVMLLCDHCMQEWTQGDWPEPYDNFVITSCVNYANRGI